MKRYASFLLAIILTFVAVVNVGAQSAETIWLVASNTAYKTGETVLVTVNAISATPIQGFTFQIRYDPACLQPTNATSPVPGMNGLQLPQTPGLVDASYASTTPQTVNGVLAEVRFVALGGCQTNLTLESAALAIRNESGFAAPLAGVTVGEKTIALNIDKEIGTSPTQAISGTPLILGEVPPPPTSAVPAWLIILLSAIFGGGAIFWFFKLLRKGKSPAAPKAASSRTAILRIQGGPHAGKNFRLHKLPCCIGRDPRNELCLDDPFVTSQHARIFVENNGYYLMDLGGGTFVNGMAVNKSIAALKSGDTVRLGKNVLFTFAA
ncbi:MAG: FHA domain-containing protein [Chloroflexi bacterium]|nr:FHA domain-containing protein [Chloroflexota bacterium]